MNILPVASRVKSMFCHEPVFACSVAKDFVLIVSLFEEWDCRVNFGPPRLVKHVSLTSRYTYFSRHSTYRHKDAASVTDAWILTL